MPSVSIKDKVVLVSGSNRGIDKSFAIQALEMGAKSLRSGKRQI
jgi:NAD(P)-dependent dehydrogenase (short-subunit alcohol dehydrogenase family)